MFGTQQLWKFWVKGNKQNLNHGSMQPQKKLVEQKNNARKRNDQQLYHKLKSELQRSLYTDRNKWLEQECKIIDEYDRVKKSKKLSVQVKK